MGDQAYSGSVFAKGVPRRYAAALVLLYLVVYLAPLAVRPLARPDEVRYGEIAREMTASGDWVSPRFNGVRYFEKPVMGHWLNAVSFKLFGETPFALRLPSAAAAGLTALLIFALMLRFDSPGTALLGSAIYLATFLVWGVGTFAVLDSYLTLFLTAAIAAYYFAQREPLGRRRNWLLTLCGVACGSAFLTKGFLGLAIPVMVIATFLIAERRWRELYVSPWIPLVTAAAVVLPWAVLVHIREPDFWHYFFWVEHVQRFIGANAQHSEPFWYYVARLPIAALPWILLAVPAFQGLRRGKADRTFIKYLVLWAGLPFLFFSFSNGKLLTYILPCMAPLAMLLALGLHSQVVNGTRMQLQWPAALLGTLFALGLVSLLLAETGALGESLYADMEWGRRGFVVAMLVGGIMSAIAAVRSRVPRRQLICIGSAALPLYGAINFALPQRVLGDLAPGAFFESATPVPADGIVISDASLFGSASWFLERDDIYVLSKGEIEYGLSYPDARHRYLDDDGLQELLAENLNRRDILIFCEEQTERSFRAQIPANARRAQLGELVLWRIPRSSRTPDG